MLSPEILGGLGGASLVYLTVKELAPMLKRRNGNGNGNGHNSPDERRIALAQEQVDLLKDIKASNEKIAEGLIRMRTDITLAMERQQGMLRSIERIEAKK